MASYENLLGRLHYSVTLSMCAMGKLTVPLESYQSSADWYVYPPALVPILSDGSGPTYLGIWRHWFSRRTSSFVKMYVERNRHAVEVALTWQCWRSVKRMGVLNPWRSLRLL